MRVVVTGGAGFIGSYLTRLLVEKNHEVIVVDNLCRGNIRNLDGIDVKLEKVDIRSHDELGRIVKNVDGVFHQAALTDVQESFAKKDEYHDVNVRGTENIFKLAKEHNFKVVYASSSSVYGDPIKVPIKEDHPRNPINPYGTTKLEDELLAERCSKDGVKIIGLRYLNVYGKGQNLSYAGVITKFVDRLKNKQPPVIFGDGTQVRDFIYVKDVVQANLLAMTSKVDSGFFNIGTGVATSIEDLAHILIDLFGARLEPVHEKPLKGDIKISQADISLAKNLLGWQPKTDLRDGLRVFLEN
jgi:UDP-glucose 4-epimerase